MVGSSLRIKKNESISLLGIALLLIIVRSCLHRKGFLVLVL